MLSFHTCVVLGVPRYAAGIVFAGVAEATVCCTERGREARGLFVGDLTIRQVEGTAGGGEVGG